MSGQPGSQGGLGWGVGMGVLCLRLPRGSTYIWIPLLN